MNLIGVIMIRNAGELAGNADLIILKDSDSLFDDFHFPENLTENLEDAISDVIFVSRLYSIGKWHQDEHQNQSEDSIQICGLNWKLEQQKSEKYTKFFTSYSSKTTLIGELLIISPETTENPKKYTNQPNYGECVVTNEFAIKNNLSLGDSLKIELIRGIYQIKISEIVINSGKIPTITPDVILVDINWLQDILDLRGQANSIFGYYITPEKYYTLYQTENIIHQVQRLNMEIKQTIGQDFQILYPKLGEYDFLLSDIINLTIIYQLIPFSNAFNVGIFFLFIRYQKKSDQRSNQNEIDTTSKDSYYELKDQILMDGISIGIALSISILSIEIFNLLIGLYLSPSVIFLTSILGMISTFGVTLINVNDSQKKKINPFNTSATNKLVLSIAIVGFVLTSTIMRYGPRIALSLTPSSYITLFILVIINFLIGMSILSTIIIFLIGNMVRHFYHLLGHKTKSINKHLNHGKIHSIRDLILFISVIYLFMSSSFIISLLIVRNQLSLSEIKSSKGGDIVLTQPISVDINRGFNTSLISTLNNIKSISYIAPIYSTIPLSTISGQTSVQNIFSESTNFQKKIKEQMIQEKSQKITIDITSTIHNYGFKAKTNVAIFGIDDSYTKSVDQSLILLDPTFSHPNLDILLDNINSNQNNCIISRTIANKLGINALNQTLYISITLNNSVKPEYIPFRVIAIANQVPGFKEYFPNGLSEGSKPGVLVHKSNFFNLLNISTQIEQQLYLRRILIHLEDNKNQILNAQLKNELIELQKNFDFTIDDSVINLISILNVFSVSKQILYILNGLVIGNILCPLLLIIFKDSNIEFDNVKMKSKTMLKILCLGTTGLTLGIGLTKFFFFILSNYFGISLII
jgi:hypothetical protein